MTVLITGASRGIGRALALAYAQEKDVALALLARDAARLADVARLCTKAGARLTTHLADLSHAEASDRTLVEAWDAHGGIDTVILNAGVGAPEWIADRRDGHRTIDSVTRTLEVNYLALVRAFDVFVPRMLARGGGCIAGISSMAEVRGFPGSAGYCASKAAATSFLESARVELRRHGIHVVTVRPGFVRTDMTAKNEFPMPFMIEAERAARIIRRGIARRRSLIAFPCRVHMLTAMLRMVPDGIFAALAGRARPHD